MAGAYVGIGIILIFSLGDLMGFTNMTLFSIAMLSPDPESITFYNLALVSFGNALSGVLFMGVGYWLVAWGEYGQRRQCERAPAGSVGLTGVSARSSFL